MKYTISSLLLLASTAFAAPTPDAGELAYNHIKRATALTDVDILNYALTLEHLENTFYKLGLSMFDQAAFDAFHSVKRVRFNIGEISRDETTHVDFLTSAITAAGGTPVQVCTYDFGLTDVGSFVKTAGILESAGVAAYAGAAQYIANKDYLTVAASILAVESRHSAYLRDNQMPPQSPFPAPFDQAIGSLSLIYTLASQFITACPSGNPTLPVKAFPYLTLGPNTLYPVRSGQTLTVSVASMDLSTKGQLYCAFPLVTGNLYTKATVIDNGKAATCEIPAGLAGQDYVVLTTSGTALTDDNTVAGPAVLMVQVPYTYGGFPM